METIKVSDWSNCPGPRYKNQGEHSAEEFREIIYPKIKSAIDNNEKIKIDLSNTWGYGVGFLEECFGGLVRECNLNAKLLLNTIIFECDFRKHYIAEITHYIENA